MSLARGEHAFHVLEDDEEFEAVLTVPPVAMYHCDDCDDVHVSLLKAPLAERSRFVAQLRALASAMKQMAEQTEAGG